MDDIYWIPHENPPRLAIVARPRGDDWLERDLANLKRGGIDILVSLLEAQEAGYLGLQREAELAIHAGLEFIAYPIPDRTTPTDEPGFRRMVAELASAARAGKHIGAHCRGCIGRSTVLIASILVQLGHKPSAALALIEKARGCVVPDTPEQRKWILSFKPEP